MTSEVTLQAELLVNNNEYIGKRWLSLTAEEQVKELTKKIENANLLCEMYLRRPLACNSLALVKEVKEVLEKIIV